ncbi:MAG: hypothetical protein RBU21_20715, partial [FCB group bacterium]|nr:hypothetical protein [FCB group bacterium]
MPTASLSKKRKSKIQNRKFINDYPFDVRLGRAVDTLPVGVEQARPRLQRGAETWEAREAFAAFFVARDQMKVQENARSALL